MNIHRKIIKQRTLNLTSVSVVPVCFLKIVIRCLHLMLFQHNKVKPLLGLRFSNQVCTPTLSLGAASHEDVRGGLEITGDL